MGQTVSTPTLGMTPLFGGKMKIHRLKANSTGASESIPDHLAGAGKNAGREPLEHGLHPDAGILVNPASGLNINLFARSQRDLKNVAVAVQPQNALLLAAGETINKKSRAAKQDVAHA